jgi:hypothetical protein
VFVSRSLGPGGPGLVGGLCPPPPPPPDSQHRLKPIAAAPEVLRRERAASTRLLNTGGAGNFQIACRVGGGFGIGD